MTRTKLLDLFARAIAELAGPVESNNPGALAWWANLPTHDGLVVFDTEQEGWAALRRQCENNIFRRGLTFEEFFAGRTSPRYRGFAPEADPKELAFFVLRYLRQRDRIPTQVNLASVIQSLATEG